MRTWRIFFAVIPWFFVHCAMLVEDDPPFILYTQAVRQGDGSVTIRWSTDVPTRGVVEVGRESGNYYLYQYRAGVRYDTAHAVHLIGLPAHTEWYYRVRTTAANGTLSFSAADTFSIAGVPTTPATLRLHLVDITDPCRSNYNPGDNFLIEFPNGKTMMIDSGDDEGSPRIISYIRSLGHDTIDYGLLTHGHYDHYSGYAYGGISTSFWFRNFLEPHSANRKSDFDNVYNLMKSLNPSIQRLSLSRAASALSDVDPQVQIAVMSAGADTLAIDSDNGPVENSKTNNASLTLKITYGQASFMMTGDLEKEAWRKWVEQSPVTNPVVDVLKVPHHSRSDAVTSGMLAATDPLIAVASTQNCSCNGLMECDASELILERHIDFFRADLANPNLNRMSSRTAVFQSNIIVTTDGSTILASHRE